MKNIVKDICLACVAIIVFGISAGAFAAGKEVKIPDQEWTFEGPFGTYDKAAMQRGLQVYREICAACHGLKRIRFRELEALGYSDAQVKALASEYSVQDGPNEEGEMFDRAGLSSDAFPEPYPNDNAARYANGGALPPDLSLMAKARVGSADYIYALLTGYEQPPEDAEIVEGKYYNKYFPGHWISMAPPIMDGQVTYSNGDSASIEQAAKDVSHFLQWASEPEMEERKRLGVQVIMFLVIFAGLMYAVKKQVWSDLKK